MSIAKSEAFQNGADGFSCYLGNYFEYRLLLVSDDDFFVENCYRKILEREPDISGMNHFFDLMRRKGKMAVISEMFFSEERRSLLKNIEYSSTLGFFRIIHGLERIISKAGVDFNFLVRKSGEVIEKNAVVFKYFNEQNRIISRITNDRLSENEEKLEKFGTTLNDTHEKTVLHTEALAGLTNFQQRYLLDNIPREQIVPSNSCMVADSNVSIEEIDAYYKAFEDQYRGSNEEIRAKQSYYIPFIDDLKKRTDCRVAIDIGCGRGEWLKLLEEENLSAIGVDMNAEMVRFCQGQHLVAVESDALAYLEIQKNNSIALVSGFHIVEHIPFEIFFGIVKQIARVLDNGGVAIFETPNPENILVGSHYFYHDFSHRNPVTPLSLSFLFKYHGFSEVRIERVNPFPDSEKIGEDSEVAKRWNNHFYGAQDYSIVAIK